MELLTQFFLTLLFLFFLYIGYRLGIKRAKVQVSSQWEKLIPEIRKDAVKKSREVLTGKFSEQLAPYLPNFPFSPTEVRFIGKPIDFIVFKGTDKKEPEEIVFVEVKSGNSKLSTQERKLRDVIKNKKVKWYEYRTNK
jgi:predicted Holliday junction resolvase-like endonuclease